MDSNSLAFKGAMKKLNSTIMSYIWPEVFFFTGVAAAVTVVSEKTSHDLSLSTTLLPVLGTALALVISFRTTSAYDRYQEGRKMWTSIQVASRNLAMIIWVHVPLERSETKSNSPPVENMIEKKAMIDLIRDFSVALKHDLRGERVGGKHKKTTLQANLDCLAQLSQKHPQVPDTPQDISGLTSSTITSTCSTRVHSPRSSKSASESSSYDVDPEKAEKPSPVSNAFTLLNWAQMLPSIVKIPRKTPASRLLPGHSIVPSQILLYLSSYTAWLSRKNIVNDRVASDLMSNILSLQDTLYNMERFCNTPLPFAYQAHLRVSLWLYMLFLPFQIYTSFGWLTIPGTAFASFLLIGFLEIGQEIEDPFGTDANDFDLNHFCLTIQRQLHEITAESIPEAHDFVFGEDSNYRPFPAKIDARSAKELKTETCDKVQDLLLKEWESVDFETKDLRV